MLKFSCNIDYIPVSVDFIENYMPEAKGAYVKVYLLAPVSYTHLDVYKRQLITCSLNLIKHFGCF